MLTLWCYGCSFTAGAELLNGKADAWPAQLGEKLGCQVVNRAKSGDSLDGQWLLSRSDRTSWKKTDIILVGVPPWTRTHIFSTAYNPAGTMGIEILLEKVYDIDSVINYYYFNYLKTLHLWCSDKRTLLIKMSTDEPVSNLNKNLKELRKEKLPWVAPTLEHQLGTHEGGHPIKKAHTLLADRLSKDLMRFL